MKKSFITLGLIMALGVSLSACASSDEPVENTESSAVEEVACNPAEAKLGDVIPTELVEDTYGSYCKIALNPRSKAATFNPGVVNMVALKQFGFTMDDAEQAQTSALKLLVEVTLDSSVLDNNEQSSLEWFEANKELVNPSVQSLYVDAINSGGISSTGLVISESLPNPLNRTGKARADKVDLNVESITAYETPGEPVIVVKVKAEADFKATKAAIIENFLKHNPDQTEESLKAVSPELFEGSEDSVIVVAGTFSYSFTKNDYDHLSGSSSDVTIN